MNRIHQIGENGPLEILLHRLVDVSIAGLPTMFNPKTGRFIHSLHRVQGSAPKLVGESLRYGAIVALGAHWLDESTQTKVFNGNTAAEFIHKELTRLPEVQDFGDLASITWAAATLQCDGVDKAINLLRDEIKRRTTFPTVELAWALSAFVAARHITNTEANTAAVSEMLLSVFNDKHSVFPHQIGHRAGGFRSHVACFADQVYPIQALSRAHAAFGNPSTLSAATKCAKQICKLQGPDGQWWWHYDARNGSILEGYPVYSVHQDAMGPMALFDLQDAGGPDFTEEIRRSLAWMIKASEVGFSLIDDDNSTIWRKVARAEPGKTSRAIQASASRIHESLRCKFIDTAFPPTRIDYECRPYHLGWVLETWLAQR